MLVQTVAGDNELRILNETFRNYMDRLEVIALQNRRKTQVRDIIFPVEFRESGGALRALADRAQDFWQDTRMSYYGSDKDKFVQEHRVIIKQLKSAAASFSRQSDELYTIYKNLNAAGRDLPLRLNWWLLESSCNDLLKTAGNILFLIRDMEKHYE